MKPTGHQLFPLGLHCPHCDEWRPLEASMTHSEVQHPACQWCEADRFLVETLIEDARAALLAHVERGGEYQSLVTDGRRGS